MKEIKYKLKGFDLMRFTPNYGNVDSQKDIEGNFGFDFAYNSEQHIVRVLINLILKQETILWAEISFAAAATAA